MATFNGTEGNDTLIGGTAADNINGNGGNDFLQGGDGADTVVGGSGNDTISGNAGNDWVRGGTGNDQVAGGGGQDSFAFADFGAANADVLTDFAGGWDNVQLDLSAFTALGSSGRFVSGDARFRLGAAAQDADDRIIYNQATGQLWYDADGSGAGAAQLIATLSNRSAIGATDIWAFGSAGSGGTINGTSGDDSLTGTSGNDTINGFAGADTLNGLGGDDVLNGGGSTRGFSDRLTGGAGADRFVFADEWMSNYPQITDFASGQDKIVLDGNLYANLGPSGQLAAGDERFTAGFSAAENDDRLIWDASANWLRYDPDGAGPERDIPIVGLQPGATLQASDIVIVNGNDGGVLINGTSGNDSLTGTNGQDTINGLAGHDTLNGGPGHDRLDGGDGNDSLLGADGDDTLAGGAGNDTLRGGPGADSLDGGLGNDRYIVQAFDDPGQLITDAGGVDTVESYGFFQLGAGIENLDLWNGPFDDGATGYGNELDNVITAYGGSFGSNSLDGGDGNDTLIGTGHSNNGITFRVGSGDYGNDSIVGTDGFDSISFWDGRASYARSAVVIDLKAGTLSGGGTDPTNGAVFTKIDDATGGAFDDRLVAHDGYMVFTHMGDGPFLRGAFLDGREGNDTLVGGATNDTLVGGSGADHFVFAQAGDASADQVNGFASGADKIDLDADAMPALGAAGNFSAGDARFFAGAGASAGHDADDRVVYDTSSGRLWYDADGNGSGAARLIATLQGAPALAATDIAVVGGGTPPGATTGTAGNDTLVGTAGNDTIDGLAGHDSISGLGGNDSLIGGEGNDTIEGGTGLDTLNGGSGDDTYLLSESDRFDDTIADAGGVDTVIMTNVAGARLGAGMENLIVRGSTSNPDPGASGNELNNRITLETTGNGYYTQGGTGNDTLIGSNDATGGDRFGFWAGDGQDVVDGRGGFDRMDFGGGAVTVDFRAGTATIAGAMPASSVTFSNVESAAGGEFNDFLIADDAGRLLWGGYGHDTLIGGAGDDALLSDGVPSAPATPVGNDSLVGGAGNDELEGGQGSDTLDGGAGNDRLNGGDGGTEPDGADRFVLASAPGAGNADTFVDFLTGVDEIRLDARFMSALGASGDFTANDPRFRAGTSAQDADDRIVFDAASGNIWYDADGSGSGAALLIARLETGTVVATDFAVDNGGSTPAPGGTNGTEANDTMTGTAGADTMNGLGGNDFMQGGDGTDTIRGGAGNDTISGNGGNDWVEGGAGNDQLSGGGGQDAFVFREFGAANADRLTDYAGNNWDSLRFDNAAFTALGADGRFASGDARFRAGTAAQDADDRIVFDSSTGRVLYDADGNGAGAAQLVATLQAGATLVASDLWVV